MLIIAIIALILSICGLLLSVWDYLELLKKPYGEDLRKALASYSDELKQTYGKSVKEIEAEWADMYSKFMRLAGRIDKTKAIDQNPAQAVAPTYLKRSDILRRKHIGGATRE